MRVGIIGAGQLGQMLGFAARDLDVECQFLDPSISPPASACGKVIQRPYDDADALAELATCCDVVTYEFENVPVTALQQIDSKVKVYPPLRALRHAQDRLNEKRLFEHLGIPLPAYRAIDTREDMVAAVNDLGLPVVIKTRRLGYDGKGQFVIREQNDIDAAWRSLGTQALIAEQWVPFDYEISSISARGVDGEICDYPLTHNVHEQGILRTSRAPVNAPLLAERSARHIHSLLEHLDYVGVLALEWFVKDDQLLANEFAPRVHNSGHWTIEGAVTSQFENHLRAVLGQRLGSTEVRGHCGMINLIGEIPKAAHTIEQGVLHDYGKEPRPGRKLGHITVLAESADDRDALLDDLGRFVT